VIHLNKNDRSGTLQGREAYSYSTNPPSLPPVPQPSPNIPHYSNYSREPSVLCLVTTSLEESSERCPCLTGGPVERGEAATGQLSALVAYPDDAQKRKFLSYQHQKAREETHDLSGLRVKEDHDVGTEIDEVCNLVQVRVDLVSVEARKAGSCWDQSCFQK
jgi:hypothetical protein